MRKKYNTMCPKQKRRFDIISKRAVVAILGILAVGNGIWLLVSEHTAPWIAMVSYAVVALVILLRNDYRAGLIIGIAGFAIHVVEMAVQGTASLEPLERTWLIANIILPLVLVWFNWTLIRRMMRKTYHSFKNRRLSEKKSVQD